MHIRDGKLKCTDLLTGEIARYVSNRTRCHCIYLSDDIPYDPNFDNLNNNPYQLAIIDYINRNNILFCFDIHGSSAKHEFAVEIGTMGEGNPSLKGNDWLLYRTCSILENHFSPITVNKVFPGKRQNTVIKAVHNNTKAVSMQLEINAKCRCLFGDALIEIINTI